MTTAPNDHSQLVPMLEVAEETTGVRAEVTLADAGYHSGSNLEEGEVRGQQVMMPESQQRASHPYHKDRFIYDGHTVSPGGASAVHADEGTRGVLMRLYRSSGKVCRRCPAFGVCTVDGRHGRAIEAGPHEGALRRHRELMLTHRALLAQEGPRRAGLRDYQGAVGECGGPFCGSSERVGRVVAAGGGLQPAHPVEGVG